VLCGTYFVCQEIYWLNIRYQPAIVWSLALVAPPLLILSYRAEVFSQVKENKNKLWRVGIKGILALAGLAAVLTLYFAAIHRTFDKFPLPDAVPSESYPLYLTYIAVASAVPEELAFRGILLPAWSRKFTPKRGLHWTAALFLVWHVGAPSFLALAPVYYLLGIALGRVYFIAGSVSVCILLHIVWNLGSLAMPYISVHLDKEGSQFSGGHFFSPFHVGLFVLALISLLATRDIWFEGPVKLDNSRGKLTNE
jgi:membrane protease YdiL (CAAX protease family)